MLNPNYVEHFPEGDESNTDMLIENTDHRWDAVLSYANKYSHIENNTFTLFLPGVVASAVFDNFSGGIVLTMESSEVFETHMESFDDFLDEHEISWHGWQFKATEPISLQSVREQRKG